MNKLPITELFGPTIQGEGLMSGTITHFLRTGGCPLKCTWCDSMHSVDPKLVQANARRLTTNEILDELSALPDAPYVTLTGGDPCMYEDLGSIIGSLNMKGVRVAVETQGTLFPSWLTDIDVITFSPKGPSSGNIVDTEGIVQWMIKNESIFKGRICIKIVVFDHDDLVYALDAFSYIPAHMYEAFYITVGTPAFDAEMVEKDLEGDRRTLDVIVGMRNMVEDLMQHIEEHHIQLSDKVHVGCQQHVLLWPTQELGV